MAKRTVKDKTQKENGTMKKNPKSTKNQQNAEVTQESAKVTDEAAAAVKDAAETAADAADAAVKDVAETVSDAADAAKTTAADAAEAAADAAKTTAVDAADAAADAAKTTVADAAEAAADAADTAAKAAAETVKDAAADGAKKETAAKSKKHSKAAAVSEAKESVKNLKASAEKSSEEIRKEREALEAKIKQEREDMKNRSKEVRKMRQDESKQKRTEMKNSVVNAQAQFRTSAKEMSSDLKNMLSKEIANMNRWKKTRGAEIMAIFAKHNFYIGGFTPLELRTTLEDLGPTYVKIGQIMSSRADLLPVSYCKELEKLRQNVKELDPAVARAVIEQETGKKINEIFKEFNDKPLGSASIGQAHSGTLLDGTKVVTKVQRPLIADMMRSDFVMLKKIAAAINTIKAGNDTDEEQLDLMAAIVELEKVTNEELDFRIEAKNTIFFKENCIQDETKVTCPTIFPELTTERIMTMTFVDGYSVSKKDRLIADGYDPNEIGAAVLDNYLHQVLDVGTFHADPHQGNIMVSHGVPTWIDFGMIGHLTDGNIKMIQDLILAIIQTDTEALVNAAMAMGAASPKTDRGKLTEDLDGLISRYMSVTNLDDLDTAALLGDVTSIMAAHHIKVPGEYTMLIRSIATIEGVIEQLCPELNLFKMITDKLLARVKKNFDLQQTLLGVGKDAMSLGKKASRIPSLVSDALNGVVKGRAKINLELTGYQELMNQVSDMVKCAIYALFSCVLFFGSCILCMTDIQPKTSSGIPLMAVAGFIFSIALAIFTVKRLIQNSQKK